jgi:hypothetical protein
MDTLVIDLELVGQLIVEDIAGIITPEHKAFLIEAVTVSKAAYALWKEKRNVLCQPEVRAAVRKARNVQHIFDQE